MRLFLRLCLKNSNCTFLKLFLSQLAISFSSLIVPSTILRKVNVRCFQCFIHSIKRKLKAKHGKDDHQSDFVQMHQVDGNLNWQKLWHGEICLNLMRSFMFDDDHEDLQGWISQLLLFLFKRRNSEIDNSKNTKIHNCRQALASIHFF